MGVVLLARDLDLDRDVALKFPWLDRDGDDSRKRRFAREARAAARLVHPNIVGVLEVVEHHGLSCMALEFIDGVDLRTLIRQRGALPVPEILRHGEALAEALRYAHDKGVLHRDVTPRNVLIGNDGRARLTDFGLARVFAAGENASETESLSGEGGLRGTPAYMSPEQALGKELDFRSDIYSFGAVLYEMCTGVQAVTDGTGGTLEAILHREPAPIARFNYEVPAELERIVRKAMAKRPGERYQHADELLADLRALRRRVESSEEAEVGEARARFRWRTSVLVAAASLALVAAAWIYTYVSSSDALPAAQPVQLTGPPGTKCDPALSPNGDFVAYTSDESGQNEIWIMELKSRATLRLTGDTVRADSPVWFPDGSTIAFVARRGDTADVMKIPLLGGQPLVVVANAMDPAISADGTRIAFTRPDASGEQRIMVAPLADVSKVTQLTHKGDGDWDQVHPTWSPDGRTICYGAFRDLWTVPAAGGKASPLTTDGRWNASPTWSPTGRFIYFESLHDTMKALWRLRVGSSDPQRLTSGTGTEGQPSIAVAAHRLAYASLETRGSIVFLDLRSRREIRVPAIKTANFPLFAPDGSRLYFISNRAGSPELWTQPLENGVPRGDPKRVEERATAVGTYSISPDGRYIAYHNFAEGRRDIYIIPSQGGTPRRVTNGRSRNVHPSWSPDGKWLAFVSNRTGGDQVWITRVAEGAALGEPEQLTFGSVTAQFPSWTPDGREVVFHGVGPGGADLFAIATRPGSVPRALTHGANTLSAARDPVSGALVVAGTWGEQRVELRRLPTPGGGALPFDPPLVLDKSRFDNDIAISPDGTRLAYVESDSRGEIWMLDGGRRSY